MTKYIVNLTNNLIGKNRLHVMAKRFANERGGFLAFTMATLVNHDIKDMKPETLGRVMCELEVGDVLASKQYLCQAIHFGGDCGDMLRELVAICLAHAILERLDENCNSMAPPYNNEVEEARSRDAYTPWYEEWD